MPEGAVMTVNQIAGPQAVPGRLALAICERIEKMLANDKLTTAQHLAVLEEARLAAALVDNLLWESETQCYQMQE